MISDSSQPCSDSWRRSQLLFEIPAIQLRSLCWNPQGSKLESYIITVNMHGCDTRNGEDCTYLFQCNLFLMTPYYSTTIQLTKGSIIGMHQRTNVSISDKSTVQFSKNSASMGGAIFVDLSVFYLQSTCTFLIALTIHRQLNSTNCCDISCSHLHNTGFPIVTSPHYLILCGDSIKQLGDIT